MDFNLILQIFILALFLSLNNFLGSIGMGFSNVWGKVRLKVAFVFALLDLSMPVLGMGIGKLAGGVLGNAAFYSGIFFLILIGVYLIYQGAREGRGMPFSSKISDAMLGSLPAIFLIGFWLSADNLFVGFSLGILGTSLILAVGIFGLVTFFMTFLGVSIGKRLREETETKIKNLAGKGRIITGIVFIVISLWKLFEGL